MNNQEQFQHTLCDRLFWHTAERDDAKVAEYLFRQKEMNRVYAMDEATLFDSLEEVSDRLLTDAGINFGQDAELVFGRKTSAWFCGLDFRVGNYRIIGD